MASFGDMVCLGPARGTGDVSADGVHGDALELGLARELCCSPH